MNFVVSPEAGRVLRITVTLGIIMSVGLFFISQIYAVIVGLISIGAVSFTLFFFRDPSRHAPQGENLILAPADGKIIDISEQSADEFIDRRCIRISIFMSVFDVHVNRIPVNGIVEYMKYHPGRFIAAFKESSARLNEMQSTGINTGEHRVLIRQIAGVVARRIRTYTRVGDRAIRGSKLGMIIFGSRLDIFLPRASRIDVHKGQKTTAGESILGVLP